MTRSYNTTRQLPESQRRILELERKNESAVSGHAAAIAITLAAHSITLAALTSRRLQKPLIYARSLKTQVQCP